MRNIYKLFFLLMVSALSFPAMALGWLDQSTKYNRYIGWACLPGSSQSVGIHIYVDGTYIGGGNAYLYREDAVRVACGSNTSSHGFDISPAIPPNLRDGKTRDAVVYAIYPNGSSAQIGNTPMKLVFMADSTRPQKAGDIVGRDLAYSWGGPLNYFGHIGIWDGANVIEAVGTSNSDDTLRKTSWEAFSTGAVLWQPASPALLDFKQRYCHLSTCTQNISADGSSSFTSDYTRLDTMLVKAAQVAHAIGASYTRSSVITPVRQATITRTQQCNPFNGQCTVHTSSNKAVRGMYRCETFILNLFGNTGSNSSMKLIGLQSTGSRDDISWNKQVDYMLNGLVTPERVYYKAQVARW